jgi:hypothetical protein
VDAKEYEDTFKLPELQTEAHERGLTVDGTTKADYAAALAKDDADKEEAAAEAAAAAAANVTNPQIGGDLSGDPTAADLPAATDDAPVTADHAPAGFTPVTPVAGSELPEQDFQRSV